MASNSPSPPTTQRRFLPQPVETSVRSSKRSHPTAPERAVAEPATKVDTMAAAAAAKPRRFLPQPVEESVRSSRKKKVEHVEDTSTQQHTTGAKDESIASKPTGRRFAPQPVETTARTSRRKFAPEPVEVSQRSSKERITDGTEPTTPAKSARKFAVEPVETTTVTRRRRRRTDDSSNESPEESSSETSSKVSSRRSTGSRRFSPELIETARGEFRHVKKDTDASDTARLKPPSSPEKSHASDSEIPESRFSAAALAKRHHEEHRRHSYCVPNLPSIESDSGDEDSSGPPSQSTSSTELPSPHKLDQIPEGEKASYLDYVRSLAERQKLQEQAMAAYINEVPHEPVSHFAAEDEDDDDAMGVMSGKEGADPKTFRRSSQDELDLELLSMRKHHEQLEQAKQEFAQDTAGASRFSAAALAARHHLNIGHPKPPAQENKKKRAKAGDSEFASMRAAASPPMLGSDIRFPFTISPRMTRCDVDQAPRPRRADSDEDVRTPESESSLWSASIGVQNKAPVGLWMGLCQKGPDEQSRPTTPIKSGLQTPAVESANPFEMWSSNRGSQTPGRRPGPLPRSDRSFLGIATPRSPTAQDDFANSIDKKLEMEKRIDEEFSNRVVTQIYNYLSLGYPSLARPFDDELSKISRIPVDELRKDDQFAAGKVKGYVGAPEGEGEWEIDDSDALRGCRRWEALRVYVREWARQSPNFASEKAKLAGNDPNISALKLKRGEAWGATVRKGSWAQ